jgi:phytol kinase
LNAWAGITAVLVALGALLAGVRLAQRSGLVGAEGARKLVHMGMGVVCLTFPRVFQAVWPVWVLAGGAVAALGALRAVPLLRREIGGVLHDVNRISWGEVYFPIGVALVFMLARGDALRFVVPVALLTFADAAGALVGKRWGRWKYATLEGGKSLEGSLAVGVVGFVCVAGPLLATGWEWRAAMLIGAVIGVFALLLEAISWRGLDNFFLPLAVYAQLNVYQDDSLGELAGKFGVLMMMAGVGLVWRRGQVVDDCARLGATLALFFFWSVGGWMWLISPLVLVASYVRLMPTVPGGAPKHDLLAVICVSSVGVVWAVAQAFAPGERWLWAFVLGLTAHQAMIAIVRFSQGRPRWPRSVCWVVGVGQAVVLQGLVFWAIDRGAMVTGAGLAAGAVWVAVGAAGFMAVERNLRAPADLNERWWKQGLAAVIASAGTISTIYL